MYTYIAAPFFNPQQLSVVELIKKILEEHRIDYFSPKDECLFVQGKTTPEEVLDLNMKALAKTELLVCVTDGKDPGTMFEAGWSYAKDIPIIYVWFSGLPGQKFNLMLGASGSVVRTEDELRAALKEIADTGVFTRRNWSDETMHYE